MTEQSWKNDLEAFRSAPLTLEERVELEQKLSQEASPEREIEGLRLAEGLRRDLERASMWAEPAGFEDLEAYVDGNLAEAEREVFESRLADDPLLREEVQDLQALRLQLATEGAQGARVLNFRRPVVMWGGLLAAAGLVLAVSRLLPSNPVEPATRTVRASTAPPPQVPERVRLHDAAGRTVLRADGSLELPERVSPDLRVPLRAALADGRLDFPDALRGLQGRAGVLMGTAPRSSGFAPVAPVGTYVRDTRPTFRWSAEPHARAYAVAVYDEQLEPQAQSGELRAEQMEWRPAKALARGRTYLWQVTALTPEGQVVTPAPPRPEARLRVLSADESQALAGQLAGASGSSLAEGVVFAGFGLLDDAEERFAALAARNPGTPEVTRLLAEVRARAR